jgi:hypothetical protein
MSGRSSPCFAAKRQRERGMIKNGARTLLGAGFVLACLGSTPALADLQVDQALERTGPWTIGYNASLKGCVASATSDDGTTIWIGFEGSEPDTPAYLAFTNPNWRSIEARKFYDLEIQVSGSYRWRGYGSGVERPTEKGLFVFGVKRRALQDFAQTSGLVLSVNKELLTQTSISGLSDAIEKLTYCQEHRLIALKSRGIKNTRSVVEPPKQPAGETTEPAPSQMPDNSRREEASAARLESDKKGPDEQAKPERAQGQVAAQTTGRVGRPEARVEGEAPRQVEADQAKQPGSEAAAGEARESAQQDHAERERIARAPDAREQETADRPGQQLPAALPSPVEQAEPELKGDALVRAIKQELKRVGCYNGLIDNDWQAAPARASIQKFARSAGVTIPVAEPTSAVLDAIKVKTERICPPEPAAYPIRRNVRHMTRKCPGGFERDEDGDCPARRRAMSRHDIDDEDRPRARSHESRRRGRVYSD